MSNRFADHDKTGYFVEDGAIRRFTTYSGVRYVHPYENGENNERTRSLDAVPEIRAFTGKHKS